MVSPLTIAGLTDGVTYDLRLRANNSAGAGRATGQLLVKPGTDTTLRDLRVVARTGNTLTFAWRAPDGVLPSTYVLQGGVVPGQTLATLPVAGAHTNATLTMPSGVFYIRVTGLLPVGASPTSNEIRVAIDTAEPPAAPSHLLGTVNGSNLELSWTNVVSGGIPTSLTLQASGAVTGSMPLPVGETHVIRWRAARHLYAGADRVERRGHERAVRARHAHVPGRVRGPAGRACEPLRRRERRGRYGGMGSACRRTRNHRLRLPGLGGHSRDAAGHLAYADRLGPARHLQRQRGCSERLRHGRCHRPGHCRRALIGQPVAVAGEGVHALGPC